MKINTSVHLSQKLQDTLLEFSAIEKGFNPRGKGFKKIAEDIQTVSGSYTFSETHDAVFKNKDLLRAYCLYFLPVNLVKLFPLLDEVGENPAVQLFNKTSLSVLDIGSGPGTFGIAFLEYIWRNRQALGTFPQHLRITFVDKVSHNLSAASHLVDAYVKKSGIADKLKVTVLSRKADVERLVSERSGLEEAGYDFIIAGNLLSEMQKDITEPFCGMVEKYLTDRGVFFAIEPGTQKGSKKIQQLKNSMLRKTGLILYAPCLKPGICPLNRHPKQWCHEKLFWEAPLFVRQADRLTGFTKEKGIKFSYLTVLKQKAGIAGMYPEYEADKIYRVVSYLIQNKGEQRLYVCNGSSRTVLRRLDRNVSGKNSDFDRAQRGDIVFIDGFTAGNDFLRVEKETLFKVLNKKGL